MKALAATAFLIAATLMLIAVSPSVSQTDADSGSSSSVSDIITGEITEDLVFGYGDVAEIQGLVTLAKDVTLTFEAGSVLTLDLSDSLSVSGTGGSAFIFEQGSSISILGKDVTVSKNLNMTLDGKVTYDSTGSIAEDVSASFDAILTVQKGTAIGINDVGLSFEDGLTAKVNVSLPALSDLMSLFSGSVTESVLNIEADISTGRTIVSYGGADIVVVGTVSTILDVSGSSGFLTHKGVFTATSGSDTIEYRSDAEMNFQFSSDGMTVTEGSSSVKLDCDKLSMGDVLQISGLHAAISTAVKDDKVDSDISGKVDTIRFTDVGTSEIFSLAKAEIKCDITFDCKPLLKAISTRIDPVELLKETDMGLSADISFESGFRYDQRGKISNTSVEGVHLSMDIETGDGIVARLTGDIRSFTESGSSDNMWRSVSFEDLDVSASYEGYLRIGLSSSSIHYEDIANGTGQILNGAGAVDIVVREESAPELSFKGGIQLQQMRAGEEASRILIGNAEITGTVTGSGFDDLEFSLRSLESDVLAYYDNVALDCGRVTYNPDTGMFDSAEVKVSGKSIDTYSDLDTIEGTITNMSAKLDLECRFDSRDLTFTMKDGSTIRDVMIISDDRVTETAEVSGTVKYTQINGYSNVFAIITSYATSGMPFDLSVKGDGHLVMAAFDDGRFNIVDGEVYISNSLREGDLTVFIYTLNGAYIVIGSDGGMRIEARPGHTLDPSTYEGFSVVDGQVVFDETKIVDDTLTLRCTCIGDRFWLTFDGKSAEVEYGSMVSHKVSSNVMWVQDSEGNTYGEVKDGEWNYLYAVLGDLKLKSLRGEAVELDSDHTAKASSDSFFFQLPGDGQPAVVESPSGLFFAVTDQKLYTDGRVNISTMESEYEGYKAYSIKTNGNVLVFFPVKSESTELYRIINGVSVKVDANYLDGGEQKFLAAKQTLDSQYYLTESSEPSDSGSEQVYRVLLVLIIAVVIAIPILARRKV